MSPRACYYDNLRRAHYHFLTRCIGWQKNDRADRPISYLETLVKTGSERIEATLCRRRIFEGFCDAHGGYETAEVRDVRRNGGGSGCVGDQEKEWMWCFLDDLRAFGINADKLKTAAQDEREWCMTAEQGEESLMAK